jgi:hypothetical protein
MQFNYEAHTAKLELRIMSLEDSVAALVGVLRTMNEMIGNLNEVSSHYAKILGAITGPISSRISRIAEIPDPTDAEIEELLGSPNCGGSSCCCAEGGDTTGVVPPNVTVIPLHQD